MSANNGTEYGNMVNRWQHGQLTAKWSIDGNMVNRQQMVKQWQHGQSMATGSIDGNPHRQRKTLHHPHATSCCQAHWNTALRLTHAMPMHMFSEC
jgi:hypothetical protein